MTCSPREPVNSTSMTSGTFSHTSPRAMAAAMSLEPMPVANAPKAPLVQVCESAPTRRSPGMIRPRSARIACSMPASRVAPTSQ